MKVEQLTCAIGAEIIGVSLAMRHGTRTCLPDEGALLKHKVLFLRDQDITRAEHVAFARRFGELEDHPVAGSDPDHPGLVRIYKTPDAAQRPLRERLAHRRHLAREAALGLRAALRGMPAGGRRHHVGQHGAGLREPAPAHQDQIAACAPATASRRASAPRCRSKSAWR
jgi:alpha-ketoglutarate-dependent taurine dioxygenase